MTHDVNRDRVAPWPWAATLDVIRRRVHRVEAGPARGLWFDRGEASRGYITGTNERPVQEALARHIRSGATVYDIGANVGFFTVLAARLTGPGGRVYAFEPVPRNAAMVRRNSRLNRFENVTVVERAVGDRCGQATLFLTAHIGGSVLDSYGRPPDTTAELRVDVVTIDEFVEVEHAPAPDIVKIDVEGTESEVLCGMHTTIAASHPVIISELDAPEAHELDAKTDAWLRVIDRIGYVATVLPDAYPGIPWRVRHFVCEPR